MHNGTRRTGFGCGRTLQAALAALSVGALAGCGEGNTGAAAVEQAADSLQALHAGGSALPPPEVRKAVYEKVDALAQQAQGKPGVNASAAASLTAQAKAGLADLAVAAAARLERDLDATADRLRADFDFRQSQDALATGLERQAEGVDIAAADAKVAALEQELAQAQARVADLEAQIADINARASSASDAAREARAEEGRIRAEAMSAGASERPAVLERAFEAQRRADAREQEGAKLAAKAASIEPLLGEAKRQASGVETRLSLARRSRAALADRRSRLAADAADARASAKSAAERVVATVQEILTARRGPLASAYQNAAEQFERTLALYGRAASGGDASARSTANMQRGVTAQRLGEVMAARATSVSALEALLRVVQDAQPPFEPAEPISAALDALSAEQAASTQAAARALSDAVEAYESALRSLGSDDRAQMESLVVRLKARIADLAGVAAQPPSGAG